MWQRKMHISTRNKHIWMKKQKFLTSAIDANTSGTCESLINQTNELYVNIQKLYHPFR